MLSYLISKKSKELGGESMLDVILLVSTSVRYVSAEKLICPGLDVPHIFIDGSKSRRDLHCISPQMQLAPCKLPHYSRFTTSLSIPCFFHISISIIPETALPSSAKSELYRPAIFKCFGYRKTFSLQYPGHDSGSSCFPRSPFLHTAYNVQYWEVFV